MPKSENNGITEPLQHTQYEQCLAYTSSFTYWQSFLATSSCIPLMNAESIVYVMETLVILMPKSENNGITEPLQHTQCEQCLAHLTYFSLIKA